MEKARLQTNPPYLCLPYSLNMKELRNRYGCMLHCSRGRFFHARLCPSQKTYLPLSKQFTNNKMVVQVNKKTESKAEKQQEPEDKKNSKIAQYLKTEYRKGTITNMRAVLK
ncbi:MAG: hypothetical protein LBL42_04465 [Tannerella sp.]|nr:hypothetical protein [Tannerella sp.]